MATARIRFLDKQEEDLVHQSSLKTLREMGVLIRSQTVLKILQEFGADVDMKARIAKIPERVVQEALRKAPRRFKLCARDPKHDFEVPVDGVPRISTDGLSVYMTDLETGKKRETTRDDLAAFSRLADALDPVSFIWPQVTASDVPEVSHTLHELWISMQHCSKHVQGDAVGAADARAQVTIASLVAGGEDALRKRPIISVTLCPIAPLSFEKGSSEAQVEFAKAGIPVSSMSMSLGGMSSPVTLAGTIVNANTENLASLVITQSAAPGAPHIYSSESAPIDMTHGTINYLAIENPLIASGLTQMARRYGLPCMIGQWGVNGREPGMPISFSELYAMVATTLSGADMCSGMGGLEDAKGGSLEQMVIDAALWEHCRPLRRNHAVDEEAIALDVVKSVGHGNTFLNHPHTVKNFRTQLFFRDERKMRWESTRSTAMVPEAREVAKRLLNEHEVSQVDRDILKRGDEFIADFERKFTGS